MPEKTPLSASLRETAPAMGPVSLAERVNVVDILRGFAIFGILLVNMSGFKAPLWFWPNQVLVHPWTGALDRAARWLIDILGEGKFYPLFSFLFLPRHSPSAKRSKVPTPIPEPWRGGRQ